MAVNWEQIGDGKFMARIGTIRIYAGQNDDGSFYWSDGAGAGKVGAPITTYQGISDPKAYCDAAIDRCKAEAEAWAEKFLGASQ